jgi:hypothetical protein
MYLTGFTTLQARRRGEGFNSGLEKILSRSNSLFQVAVCCKSILSKVPLTGLKEMKITERYRLNGEGHEIIKYRYFPQRSAPKHPQLFSERKGSAGHKSCLKHLLKKYDNYIIRLIN